MAQLEREAALAAETTRAIASWRGVGDGIVYLALRAVWSSIGALPPAASRAFLERVAGLFARLDGRHRRVIRDNLAIAFPGMDSVVAGEIARAAFRNWGRLAAEVIHCERLLGERDDAWAGLAEAVEAARGETGGLLLLTAHVGNFEVLARGFGRLVRPVAVFHRPFANAAIDAFLVEQRRRSRVATLGRGASVRDALRLLAQGGCVALPLDQNQRPGRGIFVDVLGRPASTSTVLARLSLASGSAVLPVFSVWMGERMVPVFREPIWPPPRPPASRREAVVRELTERYAAEIDAVVRRFPHQWNWAHRRWKTRPEDAVL